MDYIHIKNNLYVIGESRLSQILGQHSLIDDFVAEMVRAGRNFNLTAYLQKHGLADREQAEKMMLYKTFLLCDAPRDIRPFIRNGFAQPYIPGSAIKGAFRTAVLYIAIKNLPEAEKETRLWKPVREKLHEIELKKAEAESQHRRYNPERDKKSFDGQLDVAFFQGYSLPKSTAKTDPKFDLFRCLKVSDSAPLDRDALVVFPIRIYSAQSREMKKPSIICAECLPPKEKFEINVSFDEKLWQDFRSENTGTHWGMKLKEFESWLRQPWLCQQEMCQDVLQHEEPFFANEFGADDSFLADADMRLGWGGGLLSTSVSLLLPEELRKKMRNLLFTDRNDAPAPKSRKIIDHNEKPFYSMGWLRIATPPATL
jgi:CRISPR-associated protein Csm5